MRQLRPRGRNFPSASSRSDSQAGLQLYRSTPSHEVHRKRKQLLVLIFVDGFCAVVSRRVCSQPEQAASLASEPDPACDALVSGQVLNTGLMKAFLYISVPLLHSVLTGRLCNDYFFVGSDLVP